MCVKSFDVSIYYYMFMFVIRVQFFLRSNVLFDESKNNHIVSTIIALENSFFFLQQKCVDVSVFTLNIWTH